MLCFGLAAAEDGKSILFLAGKNSHGWGAHQHLGGSILLMEGMKNAGLGVKVEMVRAWPERGELEAADALVIYADGWQHHPATGHLDELKKFMDRGGGVTVIHWATGIGGMNWNDKRSYRDDEVRRKWRKLVGADFEPFHSVSRFWDASFEKMPVHQVTRGVPPFVIHDECYFHLRCEDPEHAHVTPLHGALPPVGIIRPGASADSGSESAVKAVEAGDDQYCAWGFERPGGGRTFGFTGGHTHWNWARDEQRKLVLNGILWSAKGEVPANGVESKRPTAKEMMANLDGNPGWTAESLAPLLKRAGKGELISWNAYGKSPLPGSSPKGPGVLEGEALRVLRSTGLVKPQGMKGFGEGLWRGNSQLWWSGGKEGDELLLELQVKDPGTYEVAVGMTKAMDYAIVEYRIDGRRCENKPIDLFQPKGVSPTGRVSLGNHRFKMGVANLGVRLMGSNAGAKPGMMFGLDYVELKKVE
jgi:hypothetical protein